MEKLDTKTKAELVELAEGMGLATGGTKAELLARIQPEVEAKEAQETAEQDKGKPAPKTDPAPPPADTEDSRPPTTNQVHLIRKAKMEQLYEQLEEELPPYLRRAIMGEIDRRVELERKRQKLEKLQSPIQRYMVTMGGRFVKDGHITELRHGAIVSENTHDLKELKRQGIMIAKIKGVEVSKDEMGKLQTRAIR